MTKFKNRLGRELYERVKRFEVGKVSEWQAWEELGLLQRAAYVSIATSVVRMALDEEDERWENRARVMNELWRIE